MASNVERILLTAIVYLQLLHSNEGKVITTEVFKNFIKSSKQMIFTILNFLPFYFWFFILNS